MFRLELGDGRTEEAHGELVVSDGAPNYVIHLYDDFPSQARGIESLFEQNQEVQKYRLLHARTEDGWLTFVDSSLAGYRRQWGGGKLSRRTYRPRLILKATTLLHEDELAVSKATVQFWGQDRWAQWSKWTTEGKTAHNEEIKVTRHPLPPVAASYRGVDISLSDASPYVFIGGGQTKVTLTQSCAFRIAFPEAVPVDEFITEWLAPLGFLVATGIKSAAGVDIMWLGNDNWKEDESGKPIGKNLRAYLNNPERLDSEDELDPVQFLHKMRQFDFAKQLPLVIDAWKAHRVTLEQYLEWIHRKPASIVSQLSYMAQLVESFDRSLSPDPAVPDELVVLGDKAAELFRGAEELAHLSKNAKQAVVESTRPTLSQRLKRLDNETGKVVSKALGGGQWKAYVPLVRNSVAHGLPSSGFFSKNRIPLELSVDILEMLFEARLLVMFGFDKAQVAQMMTKDNPYWDSRVARITEHMQHFETFKAYAPNVEVEAEANTEATNVAAEPSEPGDAVDDSGASTPPQAEDASEASAVSEPPRTADAPLAKESPAVADVPQATDALQGTGASEVSGSPAVADASDASAVSSAPESHHTADLEGRT
ncbi:hypothetical protein CMM_2292 [Clavibacter michiganensis subsp. michiganensis NCPPB 382]|uniref:ApeA N-terminal domain-containing protein n=2 Tax=Clavibacter michiganensis TaxID=28447 RepID=A5CTD7_CLAM3|nr:hypothetical protein CMM_2292 [Clavibacter michiganensis subsp. michiganensis NCPPB 382]